MKPVLSNAKACTGSTALAAIAALGVMLTMTPFAAAQEQGDMQQKDDSGNRYAQCQRLLDSPPLNELSQHVAEGWGARIRDERLGKPLLGIACSDEQIIDYMKQHGFVHRQTRRWQETEHSHGYGGYDYNKQLSFSVRRKYWLDRLFFGEYSVGADFMMLDDTIVRISAAAHM